ncbi:MAG TPA: hypothetical protein VFH91_08805 [Pyrinomonadaceae bacterium]|nr:hypothetical protein [Pyrinomonadaceae bacterium]
MYEVAVVTVGDKFIAVGFVISGAGTVRAFCRIRGADRQFMLIVVVAVEGMKVSVMKIIRMPFVTNGGVSAVLAVFMRMTLMFFAAH